VYRPVDELLNISKIANVKDWYPNLAEVARLDEQEPLLFMHQVYRAKIVWTVIYNGVVGEVSTNFGPRARGFRGPQGGGGDRGLGEGWVRAMHENVLATG
jgi:hypothetical protein